jgi:hypothetical protein
LALLLRLLEEHNHGLCQERGRRFDLVCWKQTRGRVLRLAFFDRVRQNGSMWRQERTYHAQTDINRHLYLLPRGV